LIKFLIIYLLYPWERILLKVSYLSKITRKMKIEIKKISKNIYEIPKKGKMKVPGRIYASEKILKDILNDKTLSQVQNVASLPGIINQSIALSDAHQGYGFPIGGVAAFRMEDGIFSPGGVGYDINCSVRLLKTNLNKKDVLGNQKKVLEILNRKIPSGVGRGSPYNITKSNFLKILEGGARYMSDLGDNIKEDYINTEEGGVMKDADVSKVSEKAIKRGIGQLGTLGAGNHFLEVLFVDEIFDKKVAKTFGLEEDQVVVMIHCGSRGLGHQIASDYLKKMEPFIYQNLPDRELVYAPINSELGQDYYKAMCCAVNFAFANKQLITQWVREEFLRLFPDSKIDVVYDVCHNIAKFEEHLVDGKMQKVCVHRKGATRAFGPGRKEIPEKYRKVGQPVLIPGTMGTSSYVLVGTKKAEEMTFGSTVHGAGRVMGRSQAMKTIQGQKVKQSLNEKGIEVSSSSNKSLAEEAPEVYKDVEDVVQVVHDLGISKKVARLKPLVVVKG
jgi:tRNA-splicing ligase RtcB (3'-phosphate/5'-hydroxy nucleic acid ligase)